jgi:glyoxylase-like metal-dependent hydrolase (beta-lactamase superfamily II)
MALPEHEVFAIRYACREAQRPTHFIGGDRHDVPMPMDYFVWLIRGPEHTYVVDTGFSKAMADKRKRDYLRTPSEGLALMGVDALSVKNVIITHLHYDHVGTFDAFPEAQFHLQDDEMAFATGRHMRHRIFNHSYEVEEIIGMVRLVYKDRVSFYQGDFDFAPGISLHRIGGHTAGLMCVRVHTRRGWVVLASDATHYYEHFQKGRVFTATYHLGETLDGYAKIQQLATSVNHVIPGHDPLVMQRYPAPNPQLQGIVARLDVDPILTTPATVSS